jgi:hypothetical protein
LSNKVTITVSGQTGTGKSAICGEIEIALKAVGVNVIWPGGRVNREHWTHGNEYWIDLYKPEVEIVEINVPRKKEDTSAA